MARLTAIERILDDSKYNPDKQPQAEQIVFTIQNHTIGSRQNFITLTGLPKAGKSRFISAMVASALTGNEIFTMRLRLDEENFHILHIDTEQGEWDYYKTINEMIKMAKIERMPSYFHSWTMREHEPKTIIHAVEHLIEKMQHIGIIILDGVLDLLYSYNDEAESKSLINHLKRWSKIGNCLIICILHVGKTTGSTVGHFGAMADRASQTIMECKRNDEGMLTTYSLIPKVARSADPMQINPVEIFWSIQQREWIEAGHLNNVIRQKDKITPEDYHMDMHKATLRSIFDARGLEVKYNDLVRDIYQTYNQTRKWSKECVSLMLKTNLVFKNNKGLFTLDQKTKLKI